MPKLKPKKREMALDEIIALLSTLKAVSKSSDASAFSVTCVREEGRNVVIDLNSPEHAAKMTEFLVSFGQHLANSISTKAKTYDIELDDAETALVETAMERASGRPRRGRKPKAAATVETTAGADEIEEDGEGEDNDVVTPDTTQQNVVIEASNKHYQNMSLEGKKEQWT